MMKNKMITGESLVTSNITSTFNPANFGGDSSLPSGEVGLEQIQKLLGG
jgi:hypothetical protein